VRDHVLEFEVFQAVQNAGPGAVGVFLDVEDGAVVVVAVAGAHSEVAAAGGEHVAAGRQVLVDGRVEHRHRFVHMVDEVAKELEVFGEHLLLGTLIQAQPIR
jgi:DNA/RNA endonuclease YhcR with UshA esterase domain